MMVFQVVHIVLMAAVLVILLLTVLFFSMRQRRIRLEQQTVLEKIQHEKQEDILRAIISTQEQERNRIAANLHDSVGSELSMVKLHLSKFAYELKQKKIPHPELEKQLLNIDDSIEAIRAVCRDLYPVTLQSHGFIRTFEELVSKINAGTDITCKYRINLKEEDLFTELENKLGLLRIFQEVMTNLIKYAHCSALDIGFMKYESSIKIILRHNGKPFSNQEVAHMLSVGKGVGLASINNRVLMMRGKIDYSEVNNGSEIIIELPITNA